MLNRHPGNNNKLQTTVSTDGDTSSSEIDFSSSSDSDEKLSSSKADEKQKLSLFFDMPATPKSPSTLSTRKSKKGILPTINQEVDYSSEPDSANDIRVIDDTQSEEESPRITELMRDSLLFGGSITSVKRNKSAPDLLSPRMHALLV